MFTDYTRYEVTNSHCIEWAISMWNAFIWPHLGQNFYATWWDRKTVVFATSLKETAHYLCFIPQQLLLSTSAPFVKRNKPGAIYCCMWKVVNGTSSMKNIDGKNVSLIIVGFFALKLAIADLKSPETHPEHPPSP